MALMRRPTQRGGYLPRLITVFLVPFLLLCETVNPVDRLISKVEKHYNGAQTLSVNFVENYSILGHARPPETGGLILRKGGRMRWDYAQPKGKLFISDGKNVFLYSARDNRVEKIPLKSTEDMRAPLAFLLGRLDLKKEFREFRLRREGGAVWLDASAKSDRVPYTTVEMQIGEDGNIQQLKVMGRDESVMQFQFADERLNPNVPEATFHFEPPPGAEIDNSLESSSTQ